MGDHNNWGFGWGYGGYDERAFRGTTSAYGRYGFDSDRTPPTKAQRAAKRAKAKQARKNTQRMRRGAR